MSQPVIFGEVLFDCFPDGSSVLGGAPFNVAWHLQGFGMAPVLISRLGDDERGQQVLQTMQQWGMATDGIQIDHDRPTGVVEVSLTDGQPQFDIVDQVAYDFIEPDRSLLALQNRRAPLLYHGSLAIRNPVSRSSLEILRQQGWPGFVDVNLRPPWWDKALLEQFLEQVQWIKLNDNELALLTGCQADDIDALQQAALDWRRHFSVSGLVVTRGAHGALLVTGQDIHVGDPVPVQQLVDTVGAGDAFSAIVILGLLKQWPPELILPRALAFASSICSVRGATTTDRALYKGFIDSWEPGRG